MLLGIVVPAGRRAGRGGHRLPLRYGRRRTQLRQQAHRRRQLQGGQPATRPARYRSPPSAAGLGRRGDRQRRADRRRGRRPPSMPARRSPFTAPAAGGIAAAAPAKTGYQAPRLVQGQVYSYIKDGVRHYTSKRAARRRRRQRRCARSSTASSRPATPAAPSRASISARCGSTQPPSAAEIARRGAPVRRRGGDRPRDHPCRIGLQPECAVACRRAGPDAADAGRPRAASA